MDQSFPHIAQDRTTLRKLLTQHLRAPDTPFWKERFESFRGYFLNRYGEDAYNKVTSDLLNPEKLNLTLG